MPAHHLPIEDAPTEPVPVQKPRRRKKVAWWVGGTLVGFLAIGALTGDPDTQNAASVAPASTSAVATTTSATPTTTTSAAATTPPTTTTRAGIAAGAGVGAGVGVNVPNARTTTRRATPTTTRKPAPPKTTAPRPTVRKTTEKPAAAYYKNCAAVRAAGKAPIRRGQPGYASHLDRDGDGIGCE